MWSHIHIATWPTCETLLCARLIWTGHAFSIYHGVMKTWCGTRVTKQFTAYNGNTLEHLKSEFLKGCAGGAPNLRRKYVCVYIYIYIRCWQSFSGSVPGVRHIIKMYAYLYILTCVYIAREKPVRAIPRLCRQPYRKLKTWGWGTWPAMCMYTCSVDV